MKTFTKPLVAMLAAMTLHADPLAGPEKAEGVQAATIRLENGTLRADIHPDWAGRLMFFGRRDGANAFWTNPAAADLTVGANGNALWKNVGGEKTWVGSQGAGWRAFAGIEKGSVWPPPAWFDSLPMQVVRSDATTALLRTGIHRGGDWEGAMEREFTLEPDRLVIRQRLLPTASGADGGAPQDPLPDDIRRLWSVAQIPRPERVALHVVGDGRHVEDGEIPPPTPSDTPGWVWIVIAGMVDTGKIEADGDALAAPLSDGSGWVLIRQTAPERHLSAFATPGRAMVYASKANYEPSAYVELEFAAYGPDAEQTLELRIVDKPF